MYDFRNWIITFIPFKSMSNVPLVISPSRAKFGIQESYSHHCWSSWLCFRSRRAGKAHKPLQTPACSSRPLYTSKSAHTILCRLRRVQLVAEESLHSEPLIQWQSLRLQPAYTTSFTLESHALLAPSGITCEKNSTLESLLHDLCVCLWSRSYPAH